LIRQNGDKTRKGNEVSTAILQVFGLAPLGLYSISFCIATMGIALLGGCNLLWSGYVAMVNFIIIVILAEVPSLGLFGWLIRVYLLVSLYVYMKILTLIIVLVLAVAIELLKEDTTQRIS